MTKWKLTGSKARKSVVKPTVYIWESNIILGLSKSQG
jgi:hypothetical protein